jgi:DMSO reductase family type II enzyme chaperone
MNEAGMQTMESQQMPPEIFISGQLTTDEQLTIASRISMYAILCDIFRFPDEPTRQYILQGHFKTHLLQIAEKLPFEFVMTDREIGELGYPQDFNDKEIEVEFIRLFEAGPGDPPCPLLEGLYLKKEAGRRTIFKDLILFYNHFGLSYAEGNSEDRADHLIYELEFVHYLVFLELTALQKGRDTAPLRRAQIDFLERHPAKWTGLIADRVKEIEAGLKEDVNRDVIAFYRNVILFTDRFVKGDLDYLKAQIVN